jgi:hypothetical protein
MFRKLHAPTRPNYPYTQAASFTQSIAQNARGRQLDGRQTARSDGGSLCLAWTAWAVAVDAAPEVILGPLEKTSQKRLSCALVLNAAYA